LKTVGVFDSGVGGLSVLRALLVELPDTRFVYLADNAFAPYGERSAAEVSQRSHRITGYLREVHAIDALVVACNTATALAVDSLRKTHPDLPIIGVEPALKPAVSLSRSGRIGVLATRGTLDSARFALLRERQASQAKGPLHFISQPCDGLAAAIERDDEDAIRALCERYILSLCKAAGSELDTVVLGCTHYPFAMSTLALLCGPTVTLVDTAVPVARRTREVLGAMTASPDAPALPPVLLATRDPQGLAHAVHRWLGLGVTAQLAQP
jgi:glutamate racemase